MSQNRDHAVILAIDTAGPILGIALSREDTVLDTIEADKGFHHVEELVPRIDELLTRCVVNPKEIDAVAVSAGPGSFTGLRVGMATAKGIALAQSIPIYSVGTLDALARQECIARRKLPDIPATPTLLVPILDARKGRVYAALFRAETGTRLTEDLDIPLEELASRTAQSKGSWICIGPEALHLAKEYGGGASISQWRSAAVGVALVAAESLREGLTPDQPYAGPNYLRSSDIGEKKRMFGFTEDSRGRA